MTEQLSLAGNCGQWRLTDQQKQEAVRLYEMGESISKVAAQFGVSRQSMWGTLWRRTVLRDRVDALPRKPPDARRRKRAEAQKRYYSYAARATRAQIKAVKARDVVCQICGGDGTQIDHVLPMADGGQTKLANLQLLCSSCHAKKTWAERKSRESS